MSQMSMNNANESKDLRPTAKLEVLSFLRIDALRDVTRDQLAEEMREQQNEFNEEMKKRHRTTFEKYIEFYDIDKVWNEFTSRQVYLQKTPTCTKDVCEFIVKEYALDQKDDAGLDDFITYMTTQSNFDAIKQSWEKCEKLKLLSDVEIDRRLTVEFLEKILTPYRPKKKQGQRGPGKAKEVAIAARTLRNLPHNDGTDDDNDNNDNDNEVPDHTVDDYNTGMNSMPVGAMDPAAVLGQRTSSTSLIGEEKLVTTGSKRGRKPGDSMDTRRSTKHITTQNEAARKQLTKQLHRLAELQHRVDPFEGFDSDHANGVGSIVGGHGHYDAADAGRADELIGQKDGEIWEAERNLIKMYQDRADLYASKGEYLHSAAGTGYHTVWSVGTDRKSKNSFFLSYGNPTDEVETDQHRSDLVFAAAVLANRSTRNMPPGSEASKNKKRKKGPTPKLIAAAETLPQWAPAGREM